MAAERSESLRELVRRIINNVNRTETGNGRANTQSASISVPNGANSTNEELNQRIKFALNFFWPLGWLP